MQKYNSNNQLTNPFDISITSNMIRPFTVNVNNSTSNLFNKLLYSRVTITESNSHLIHKHTHSYTDGMIL